jgi:hypothetical protein
MEESSKIKVWSGMVHATFRKVIAFDILFLALGIIIGVGIATMALR